MKQNNYLEPENFSHIKEESGEIWVTSFDYQAAIQFRKELFYFFEKYPKKPIIININSLGGDVFGLFLMIDAIDAIKSLPDAPHIITACSGCAMSAGAALLSHGTIRFATENSSIMLHQVSSFIGGAFPDLEIEHEELAKINKKVLTLLYKNCKFKGDLDQLKDLVARNKYLDPKEAKDFGIIDIIGIPKVLEDVSYSIGVLATRESHEPRFEKSDSSAGKKAKQDKSLRKSNSSARK
jgi:ATP-dependent Clp endopeptidase proteolytic subunit ClpP